MSHPSNEAILRKLFWKLFFRGRALSQRRGKEGTVNRFQMVGTLVFYGIIGFAVCVTAFVADTITFSTTLHGITLFMVIFQMVVTAGNVLFNKEEAEILLHRPVAPRELLRAKVFVLCAVSAMLAGALNLPGMIVGIWIKDAHWWFPLVHLVSMLLMVVFSAGALVVVYQTCLRWFGRERLDNMMTTMQTALTVLLVIGSQSFRFLGNLNLAHFTHAWWVLALPPMWFASLDTVLAAKHWEYSLLIPALFGVAATVFVGWLGFHRLAESYGEGLMTLNEAGSDAAEKEHRGRWLRHLVKMPPLAWWLRDPVERHSFLLTTAYFYRDRETKLRLYPGMAQILVMPLVVLFGSGGKSGMGSFGVALAGIYIGWIPMMAMQMMEFSEHWRAVEIFQFTPKGRWQSLFHGARKAALVLLTFPAILALALVSGLLKHLDSNLLLLLPSLIIVPVWSLIPGMTGPWLPLSKPFDGKAQAQRGCGMMIVVMTVSALLCFAAWFSMQHGWLSWFLLAETAVAVVAFYGMRAIISDAR